MNYKFLIGQRIKSARESIVMKQERLAELLNVTIATVSQWENGKLFPRLERLVSIAEITDKQLDYFFRAVDEPQEENSVELTAQELYIVETFRKLNQSGQDYLLECTDNCRCLAKYKKSNNRAVVNS